MRSKKCPTVRLGRTKLLAPGDWAIVKQRRTRRYVMIAATVIYEGGRVRYVVAGFRVGNSDNSVAEREVQPVTEWNRGLRR